MEYSPTRKHERIALSMPIKLSMDGTVQRAWLTNISMGGVFVRCARPPSAGDEVGVRFVVRPGTSCEASGRVVQGTAEDGFGVAFEQANTDLLEFCDALARLPAELRVELLASVLEPRITVTSRGDASS